jgi:hypothetical protein
LCVTVYCLCVTVYCLCVTVYCTVYCLCVTVYCLCVTVYCTVYCLCVTVYCTVYCLCVTVYCTTAPGVNPRAINKIYHIIYDIQVVEFHLVSRKYNANLLEGTSCIILLIPGIATYSVQ